MKSPHSFGKDERLFRKRDIQELFDRGSSFYLHPFKVIILEGTGEKHQVLITVSRRNFKRAVDRNLLKRRIREGYRLNKSILPQSPQLQIAFIFTGREIFGSDKIHSSIRKILTRLSSQFSA